MIGISPEAYRNHLSGCNRTLQYAVSSCFEDITPQQVTHIRVTAVPHSSARIVLYSGNDGAQGNIRDGGGAGIAQMLRGMPRTTEAINVSHVSYVVTSYNPDDTYDQMRATIDGALARGKLTEQLQYWAHQFNVSDLYNVTLTSPNTTQVAGPGIGHAQGNPSKLSTAAIVGIVLGSVFLLLLLYALYRFVVHVKSDDRIYLKY
jgi:hypothetical protein